MQTVFECQDYLVIDDLLDQQQFEKIWQTMNRIDYRHTLSEEWIKVWNIQDGLILRGDPVESDSNETLSEPFSDIFRHVYKIAGKVSTLQGATRIYIVPYMWPPLTSISWHSDGFSKNGRLGAFTYYCHKNWNCEWGGELMFSQERGHQSQTPFDNSELNRKIQRIGIGTWISPKPNRMVVLNSDILHHVNKTTANATPRLTLQGFITSL